MRIGLVFDIFAAYEWKKGEPADADAEYEPEATVEALEKAVAFLGHKPVRIGTSHDLLAKLPNLQIDAVINIAEGMRSRNREAYAPVLLEMAEVPFLGSDALTLSLSLDKVWTKDLAVAAGIPTPGYASYTSSDQITELPGAFPLFVKPRYEGSSKGITPQSKVNTLEELKTQVDFIARQYQQDALVEAFIEGGGEFTVAVLGHNPPVAMPALQRAIEAESGIGLHALDRRGFENPDLAYKIEGELSSELEARLQEDALNIFNKLECHDFARIDFRVDGKGQHWFLEINPLPTFAPDGTFAILAELMGTDYTPFLADTIAKGLERLFGSKDS